MLFSEEKARVTTRKRKMPQAAATKVPETSMKLTCAQFVTR